MILSKMTGLNLNRSIQLKLSSNRKYKYKLMSGKQAPKFHTDDGSLPDLASASDWSCCVGILLQPIRITTQTWVVMFHQYGISALVSQTSPVVASQNVGCFLRPLNCQCQSLCLVIHCIYLFLDNLWLKWICLLMFKDRRAEMQNESVNR